MAWRCGSLPRTLMSTARSSSIRSSSSSSLPRLRPSQTPLHANRLHSRRSLPTWTIGALGWSQSLLPLHSVVTATRLTSHISVEARACCELSQGRYLDKMNCSTSTHVLHHMRFEVRKVGDGLSKKNA